MGKDDAIAFAEALEEVALQLSGLDPHAESPPAIAATTAQVQAEYGQLSLAAALFGMDGVQQAADWVQGLLAPLCASVPDAVLELLQTGLPYHWIELTAIALREPDDSSHLAALSAELMNPDWPQAPAPELLEKLLLNLRIHLPAPSPEADSAAEAPPANPLAWDADIHPELLDAYLQETPGQIAETARLLHLLAQGNSSAEQKRQAARLAHTVKGASGVVGVEAIARFTHKLEDVLEFNLDPHLHPGLGETLGASADCLEALFENLQEHQGLPAEYPTLLAELSGWEQRLADHAAQTSALEPEPAAAAADIPLETLPPASLPDFILQTAGADLEDDAPIAEPAHADSAGHLNVPLETVQRLLNLAGELITATSQMTEQAQRTLATAKQLQQQDEHVRQMLDELTETIDQQATALNTHALAALPHANQFDQLELDAYNDLQSVSGLLTESVADSRELARRLQQQLRQISDQVFQQQRLQRQLSETVLRTRMVPVQSLSARIERTVRETCRRTGKQAQVEIHGQNLLIDTGILQGLTAPLLHMLRNAIDHGIETPEERQAVGKNPVGNIQLQFEQKGNQIHLTLHDDGRGMEVGRIHARALERGLIQAGQTLSPEDTLRLILRPGFTTRDEVNEISGRGIGMDVVQTAVEKLQGVLHLSTDAGLGSRVHIQVPLTLIATNALLVRVGNSLIAIPTDSIQQLLYVAPEQHIRNGTDWHIQHNGLLLEVLTLADLFGWSSTEPPLSQGLSLLLVNSERKGYVVYVDEVLQPRDIVVKSLAPWLNLTQGISGACILANGAVAPVLDLPRLLRQLESGNLIPAAHRTLATEPADHQANILIVDDSLSNRKALSLMVEQLGYRAITALDGLDALKHLHEQRVEMILTDLEMPRMNGLELIQAVRMWPEVRHLPILMITSRSTQKHRQMAEQAGVDEYLTKPIDRDTLAAQLRKWLSTQLAT